jgi:hypothetical protein
VSERHIEQELAKLREEFEAFRERIDLLSVGFIIRAGDGSATRKGGDVILATGSKGLNSGESGGRILFIETDTKRKLVLDFESKTFQEVTE